MSADLEARINALSTVLIAHIASMDRVVLGSAQATVHLAQAMRDEVAASGDFREAKEIGPLLDELRGAADLPAND